MYLVQLVMSLKVEACEKQCITAKWCFVIPQKGRSAVSPLLSFEGRDWTFQFHSNEHYNTGDRWTLNIVNDTDQCSQPPKFLLTTHIRNKNSCDKFMTYCVIDSKATQIFSLSQFQFFNNHPEVECFGNILTFIFKFYNVLRDYTHSENTGKQDKSIQTSLYMDDSLKLSCDLSKLMEDDSNPDVELRCGECTIPAHQLILSARSDVFRSMLQSDMREGREGVVEIVDMDPKVLEIFIRYLYTGNLHGLSVDIALALYTAAEKYQVEAMRASCSEFLIENTTVENACTILALAFDHSDKELKDHVMAYVLENKVPKIFKDWSEFCENYPKLAMEVLNHAYMMT